MAFFVSGYAHGLAVVSVPLTTSGKAIPASNCLACAIRWK